MKTEGKKFGFTLVELLTVMAVIAILIGLLVPALNLVRKMAKDTNQKAQFHSISVSLDMFNGENDGYPDSYVRGSSKYTIGAQHLAEALIGRDFLGLDPMTTWNAEADKADKDIYASQTIKSSSADQEKASLARRKGPYLSSENVEAYDVGQLYTNATPTNYVYDNNAPVLTDNYRVKDIQLSNGKNVKAGSPILYYKANTSLTGINIFPNTLTQNSVSDPQAESYIFNSIDNEDLLALGLMKDQANYATKKHRYDPANSEGNGGRWIFYDEITNPKITSQPRPYNASTYLLISAGFDGIYGTNDDITNFGD